MILWLREFAHALLNLIRLDLAIFGALRLLYVVTVRHRLEQEGYVVSFTLRPYAFHEGMFNIVNLSRVIRIIVDWNLDGSLRITFLLLSISNSCNS